MAPLSSPTHPADPLVAFGPARAGEDPVLEELADLALRAALQAGEHAAAAFGGAREHVETKSSATDMVSEVDRAAEAIIVELIDRHRPTDGLLGEEGASRPGSSGVRWVVDPLDGTTNYLFGVPAWSVSIAAEVDGQAVVGVVLDPSRQELWAAVAGRGALCNGDPVRVADGRSSLGTALIATGFGYESADRAWQGAVAGRLVSRVRDIRRFGSAALDLCWVAGGRTDGYYEWGLNPWDRAAGALICTEAGGTVEQSADGLTVATTPSLRAALRELLDELGAAAGRPGSGGT